MEGGNYWKTECVNNVPITSNFVPTMMHDIHVLVVDHDTEALINTTKQLEMLQYKVSYTEHANQAAMALGNLKVDVVMANINFPDPNGFKLLQRAVDMCILVVWMFDDDNAMVAMRALENGAFLCVKRPPTMEFMRCLWQHVIREQTRMIRDSENMLVASSNLGPVRGGLLHDAHHQRGDQSSNPNPMMMMRNKGRRRSRGRQGDLYDKDEYQSDNNLMMNGRRNGNVKRKLCTEWTQELHAKFMDAVEQLGDGRCFPKEILELMNEPGLTRMQVASHLQKCRNDNWRSPEERKSTHNSSPNGSMRPHSRQKRFGEMPWRSRPSSSHIHRETGQSSETHWEIQVLNNEHVSNMTNNNPNHLETSSNPRHGSDEFFNFPDMDSLIHEPESNNLSPAREGYQVDPTYKNENV